MPAKGLILCLNEFEVKIKKAEFQFLRIVVSRALAMGNVELLCNGQFQIFKKKEL